jgi:hypothetical protein
VIIRRVEPNQLYESVCTIKAPRPISNLESESAECLALGRNMLELCTLTKILQWDYMLGMDALDKACETGGQWVLERAKELATSEGVPMLFENRSQYEENRVTHGPRGVPALRLLIRQLYDREIWRRPEMRSWIRAYFKVGLLTASPGLSLDQASDDDFRNWFWILLNPLSFLIEKRETLDLSATEIVETYRLFRKASGKVHCEVVVPLLGIEGDLPTPLKLGSIYQLSYFTPDEKNRLAGRWLNQGIITSGALQRSKFKLSFEEDYKQEDAPNFQEKTQTEAERVITALRLAARGRVGAQAFFGNRELSGLGIAAQNLPNLYVPEFITKALGNLCTSASFRV